MKGKIPTILAALACAVQLSAGAAPETPRPPDIMVILVDDMGVGDFGFSGGKDFPTPNIDRLAMEGTICTNAYVNPSCSPTRAAILTGRYPGRFGIEDNRPLDGPTGGMDVREVTLPQLLRSGGYETALIGKWHLGQGADWRFAPRNRGFDSFLGWIGAAGKYIDPPLSHDGRIVQHPGWVDDILTDRAIEFINAPRERPFFLHLATMAVHLPQEAHPEDLQKFPNLPPKRRMCAALATRLDAGIGRLMEAVRTRGTGRRTLVFFLSDNGAEPAVLGSSNGPHRGQKFDVLEGGIHVPFAVWCPGVVPAGKTYEPMVHGMDIFTTSIAAAGTVSDVPLDGVDLLPFLQGRQEGAPHQRLFWIYNKHEDWRRTDQDTNLATRRFAVREGDWKLVVEGSEPPGLFLPTEDPGERNNLAASHPERVADMRRAFDDWYAGMVKQVIPDDHPLYGKNRVKRKESK